MSTHDDFLAEIDDFLAKHRLSDADFGRRIMNDHKFVPRLRGGASTTLRTADKVRKFMEAYHPGPLARRRRVEARSAA